MIVFIYDTECLKDEAGDPVEALLYFYPGWVSDSQKVALCGQLMGSSYFLKDCFFKPRILSLQTGKFILKEFGHFILAVGTDRNISDYLLHYRADLLTSLVHLYHRDLQTVCEKFTLNGQYKNIAEKLYHIFETYLPILQHNGNIFHNVPKLCMPKPASTIFLDALQTLEWCQQTKGVLGGAILYHNKIVATQLNDQISKQLALTDPLHIRTTAEQLNLVDFHIPNGVQMMAVYINQIEYNQLVANAQLIQNVKVVLSHSSAENAAFTFTKRKMKREESLIFTNIPEECSTATIAGAVNANNEISSVDAVEVLSFVEAGKMEDQLLPLRPTKPSYIISLQRPTHLSLHFKDISSREIFELGTCPINFDEGDSFPEYIGRTSVCVTPLTDNKILLLDNKLSICRSSEISNKCGEPIVEVVSPFDNSRRKSFKIDLDNFFQHFLPMKSYKLERRKSFTDFYDSIKRISKKLSLKKKNPIFDEGMNENYHDFAITCINFIEHGKSENEWSEALNYSTDRYNSCTRSIPDPTHPVFINNGQSISRSLFQEFVEQYYEIRDKNSSKNMAEISEHVKEFKVIDREVVEVDDTNFNSNIKTKSSSSVITGSSFDRNLNLEKPRTSVDKKSLSLPLKPLSTAPPFQGLKSDLPMTNLCKQPTGIPLTPLMAKLSVLAFTEVHNTGKLMSSNWGDEDSHDVRLPRRRFTSINSANWNDTPKVQDGGNDSNIPFGEDMQRVELYICGQQNMTLLLLMEHGSCGNQPIVQDMFDICVAKFPQMESSLTEMLNISIESDQSENEYSFMCIDSKWDMLQRAGAWSPIELNIVNKMHRDLKANEDITDLIIRSNDCILYGCQTGRTEIFYKEAAHQTTGIPLPSDPMSNIEVHARTRLDRDRSLVLL